MPSTSGGAATTTTTQTAVSTEALPPNLPSPPPEAKTFFDLPIELRLKIYENLLCYRAPILLVLDQHGECKRDWGGGQTTATTTTTTASTAADKLARVKIQVQIFRVNKAFNLEAAPVLYLCNKFTFNWASFWKVPQPDTKQTISKLLHTVEVSGFPGPVWGYVNLIKYLADTMPGLQKVEFDFVALPYRLLAAAVELTASITPCSSGFRGPELRLDMTLVSDRLYSPSGPEDHPISQFLSAPDSRLRDVAPVMERARPGASLNYSAVPGLSLIKLNGTITAFLLRKIEEQWCSINNCTWMKTNNKGLECEDAYGGVKSIPGKRVCYTWQASGRPVPVDRPQVDMLQWYPELSESIKQALQDFLDSRNENEGGAIDKDKTKAKMAGGENGDHCGENSRTTTFESNDDEFSTFYSSTSSALSAHTQLSLAPFQLPDLNDLMSSFNDLPFSEGYDGSEINAEVVDKTPEEIEAVWAEEFGFPGPFLVGSAT